MNAGVASQPIYSSSTIEGDSHAVCTERPVASVNEGVLEPGMCRSSGSDNAEIPLLAGEGRERTELHQPANGHASADEVPGGEAGRGSELQGGSGQSSAQVPERHGEQGRQAVEGRIQPETEGRSHFPLGVGGGRHPKRRQEAGGVPRTGVLSGCGQWAESGGHEEADHKECGTTLEVRSVHDTREGKSWGEAGAAPLEQDEQETAGKKSAPTPAVSDLIHGHRFPVMVEPSADMGNLDITRCRRGEQGRPLSDASLTDSEVSS